MSSFTGMRIGLVGPLPPPAGGMATQTRQLAELLQREQASVEIVQSNAPYRPAFASRLPVLRAAFRLLPYLAALWRMAGRNDVIHVMANSGWSWHLFAAPAIWIARLRGVPVIVNYRGGEAASFLERSAAQVRWTMRQAARLVVPSNFLDQIFARHRMPAEILPNVVDLERFRPRGPRLGSTAHLVVARNLEPLYDNATALRAFQLVVRQRPEAHLTIAGSGPEAGRLRTLAEDLGVSGQVRFIGRLDREGMARLYTDADVVLNPSLADNMPNSLLEALACGVPVVSTDVGGVPFMVQHERTALLVPRQVPQAMAAQVLRLLDDPALWSRLAQAGLAEARLYAWPRVAPKLASLYHSVLSRAV